MIFFNLQLFIFVILLEAIIYYVANKNYLFFLFLFLIFYIYSELDEFTSVTKRLKINA